jgi:uncharacterized protein YecT (DUF1311 family)
MAASMNESYRRILNCLISAAFTVAVFRAADAAAKDEPAPGLELPDQCYANELELSRCLAALADEQEARLDTLVARVRAELLPDRGRKAFDDLHEEWKKYRHASCDFEYSRAAGNSASTRYSQCMLDLTRFRLSVLGKYLVAITTGGCGNDVWLQMIESGAACQDVDPDRPQDPPVAAPRNPYLHN